MSHRSNAFTRILEQARRHAFLEASSLIYLFLPCLIFVATHLRFVIGIPLVAATAWGMYRVWRESRPRDEEATSAPGRDTHWLHYAAIFAIIVVLVLYSGMAGYATQIGDYGKHNAFLSDLIQYSWPLSFAETHREGVDGPITYYLLYYLPAALVGKALGWTAANHFTALWGVFGLSVCVFWFLRIVGKVSVIYALLFLFFGGLDLVGWIILHGWPDLAGTPLNRWVSKYFLETESLTTLKFLYPTHLNIFAWAPHQALPVWITTAMLLYAAMSGKHQRSLFFVASSLPLWTSFGALGTIPFVLLAAIRGIRTDLDGPAAGIKRTLSFRNAVTGPALVVVAGLYLMSSRAAYPHGFLWEWPLPDLWALLLLFYLIEFGIYVIVMPPGRSAMEKAVLGPWVWTAVGILIVLPVYYIGHANDFVMRTCMPAIAVLVCYFGWRLRHSKMSWRTIVLVALLVIGTAPGWQFMGKRITRGVSLTETIDRRYVRRISEGKNPYQYFGNADSFFFKYLSRELEYQPVRYDRAFNEWDFANSRRFDEWVFPPKARFTAEGVVMPLGRFPLVVLHEPAQPVIAADVSGVRVTYSMGRADGKGTVMQGPALEVFFIYERSESTPEYPNTWTVADGTASTPPWTGRSPRETLVRLRTEHVWRGQVDLMGIRVMGLRPGTAVRQAEITIHRIEFVE